MTEFYNKVLNYSDQLDSAQKSELIDKLPRREYFVEKFAAHQQVLKTIEGGKPLLFLPNDIVERNYKREKLVYEIVLFGILRDGTKAAVILTGINISFDVMIPDSVEPGEFFEKIAETLKTHTANSMSKPIYASGHKIVKLKPFKGFTEKPFSFMRLFFNTSFYRSQAIQELQRCGYSTYNDDPYALYNKIFREYKIKTCGWNTLTDYTAMDKGTEQIKWVRAFKCDIENIKSYDFDLGARENEDLKRDKSIIMNWDIETYSPHPTGNPPLPENVWRDGKFEDTMHTLCCTCHWIHNREDFLRVSITYLPCEPRDDCLIIQCKNQMEIIKLKTLLVNRMLPEFLDGFNDGLYDWPFLLYRAELSDRETLRKYCEQEGIKCPALKKIAAKSNYCRTNTKFKGSKRYGKSDDNKDREDWIRAYRKLERDSDISAAPLIVNFMKKRLSLIEATRENMMYNIQLQNIEDIKLEAGNQKKIYNIRVPGMICFDTRVIFQQLYPTSEKSSLNYYLAINNLGSKEDMTPGTMFKICRVLEAFKEHGLVKDPGSFAEHIKYLRDMIAKKGPNYILFPKLKGDGEYNVSKLTAEDTLHLIGGDKYGGHKNEGISQLIHYCNIDSRRCQELLHKKNVIMDRREMGNKTYTSMYDNFYRAGGMKVRNKVMAEGCEWNLAFGCVSKHHVKDSRKYPGAYVLSPQKGLYRDHRFIKLKRCQTEIDTKINYAAVTPCEKGFDKKLIKLMMETPIVKAGSNLSKMAGPQYMTKKVSLDRNLKSDRPCAGLDFSSLYPSLIITYNISPEKIVTDKKYRDYLVGKGYQLLEIQFRYAELGTDDPKDMQHGWIVQHTHPIGALVRLEVARAQKAAGGSTDPNIWAKHVNADLIKSYREKLLATTLDEWKRYGMGLYPWILKQLFDERRQLKKQMEKYEKSKEFLASLFQNTKIEGIEPSAQILMMSKYAATQITRLERDFKERGEKYFHEQAESIRGTMKFLHEAAAAEYKGWRLEDVQNEILFSFNYFNSKQLSLKVFMNTFYGETGNSLSPFFMVLVAGAITTMGQKSLRMVVSFALASGFGVHYGDTDSAYTSAADRYFVELDKNYEAGKISKLDYWIQMVKITMTALDQLKSQVNDLLLLTNGTTFLNMAYEEVLWPFALLGKKKYIGIPHQGMVNTKPWLRDCSPADFKKSLFIRGLEIKKRISSEVLKNVCYELFQDIFCIESCDTLKNAVERKLETLAARKFDVSLFIKNAKYKLPEPGHPGNKSVLSFIDRMNKLRVKHPDLVRDIEVGERFPYVVVRRYPWKYDLRGRKVDIKVGDKYEYPEMLTDQDRKRKYEATLGETLEIDIDYYITNEIIGQFARLIVYHPDYDKYWKQGMTDEEYKKADEDAWAYAKKCLGDYYDDKFAQKYVTRGDEFKRRYKKAATIVMSDIQETYGEAAGIFLITNNDVTGNTIDGELQKLNEEEAFEILKAKAEKYAKTCIRPVDIDWIATNLETKADVLYKSMILAQQSYYQIARKYEMTRKDTAIARLKELVPTFNECCERNVGGMVGIINGASGEHLEANDKIYDLFEEFINLTTATARLLELENMKNSFNYIMESKRGKFSVMKDVMDNKTDFYAYLKKRMGNLTLHPY
jgi:DNA polymerase elongation subunit (family B)